jgi:hypothetical protein
VRAPNLHSSTSCNARGIQVSTLRHLMVILLATKLTRAFAEGLKGFFFSSTEKECVDLVNLFSSIFFLIYELKTDTCV